MAYYKGKWFYQGFELQEYCRLKYLDYKTIIKYITDPTKLVNGLKSQDLLESLLLTYSLYEDLTYGDEILSLYVVKNGGIYQPILDRIVTITEGDPNKVSDTIIDNVLFRFKLSKNTKYRYKDEDLDIVAKNNQLNAFNLERDIKSARRNFPKKNVQDIVDEIVKKALEKAATKEKRYFYKNVPLKEWCEKHFIDYGKLVNDANNPKVNPSGDREKFYNDMLSEIEKYQDLKYGDVLFITYCIQNKISYYTAIKNFIKFKNENPTLSDKELIELVIFSFSHHNHGNKLEAIRTEKKQKSNTRREPKKEKNDEEDDDIKYKYKGFDLRRVCYSLGLNFSKTIKEIKDKLSESKINNLDLLIEIIVMNKLRSFPELYIYQNKLLLDYCLENNIDYREVVHYIVTNKDQKLTIHEKVHQAILKYTHRRSDSNLYKVFNYLRAKKNININELKQVCDITDIDFKILLDNKTYHIVRRCDAYGRFIPEKDQIVEELSDYNTVMLTWYCYDERTDGSYKKFISDSKLNQLITLFEKVEENSNNKHVMVSRINLYLLIVLYKSGLYRSSDLILMKVEDYINCIIDESRENKWLINPALVKQRFMEAVDSCVCSDEKEMLSYINSCVRARFGLPDREPTAKSMKYISKKKEKKEDK